MGRRGAAARGKRHDGGLLRDERRACRTRRAAGAIGPEGGLALCGSIFDAPDGPPDDLVKRGSATLFRRTKGALTERATLVAAGSAAGDECGVSVALGSGGGLGASLALVGGFKHNTAGAADAGRVWAWSIDATGSAFAMRRSLGDSPPYGESGALRPLRDFSFGGPLRRTQTSERRVREHPSIGAMDGPPVPSTAHSAREVMLKNIELKRRKRSLRGSPINSEGSFQHRMEHQDGLTCANMRAERLIVSRLVRRHSNVDIGVNSDI